MVKAASYRQRLAYLESLWDRQPARGFKTDNIKAALKAIGDPQNRYKVVHIGGTSGKGSVVALVSLALAKAGFKTGAYYSPYLESPRELIQINGKMISKQDFANSIGRLKPLIKKHHLTFFEAKTLLAFNYFAKKKVDWAVVEIGLGGRLDATNVISPQVSVITNIDLDHTDILGSTIEKIAREKAGIIKAGVPVVSGVTQNSAKDIIDKVARARNAQVYFVKTKGTFDQRNFQLAKEILERLGLKSRPAVSELPGRFEQVGNIIMDGAHNPAKVKALVEKFKKEFPGQKAVVLFGALAKKDYKQMIKLLKPITRALVTTQGQSKFHDYMEAQFKDPKKALSYVKSLLKPSQMLIITGSLYLLGELRHVVLQRPKIS